MQDNNDMPQHKNSDTIRRTLFSLIYVSSSKTSKHYAWSIIKKMLNDLKPSYNFIRYISIDEVDNLQNSEEDIVIEPDFDGIEPKKVGKLIQNIIDNFKSQLGEKAGYFFLLEFKNIIGEEYLNILKNIGVDLRLIDLQKEIYCTDNNDFTIKDQFNSNIAFIKKKK